MSFKEYIENSKDWEPTNLVMEAIQQSNKGKALDIGCGALRDSLFLEKKDLK
jgi:hypothetical protein